MYCTDMLGNLNAGATVSANGVRGEYYVISTTIREGIELDLGKHYATFEDAVATLDGMGFEMVERKADGFGWPKATMVHTETMREIERRKAESEARYTEPGYIRFGKVPESGRSVNYATGTQEAGVSCFKAVFDRDGRYQVLADAKLIATMMTIRDREIYRLWGEEVGIGSDGELLLKVSKMEKISGR